MRKTAVAFIIVILLISGCLCACEKTETPPAPSPPPPSATIEPEKVPWRQPVYYELRARDYNGGYFTYPYVKGGADSGTNLTAFNAARDFAEKISVPVYIDLSVTYNDQGVFSYIMNAMDIETYEYIDIKTVNVDCETGEQIPINMLFARNSDKWRHIIPDIIELQLKLQSTQVIGELLPVSDAQEYLIEQDNLIIIYRNFELMTDNPNGGPMAFSIPFKQLIEFVDGDCVINRILAGIENFMEAPLE